MPVTIVVGGQYGSEGKGKVAHWVAREKEASAVVRVGGSNSGHTVVDPQGNSLILRCLPTASVLPEVTCVIAPGSYVDPRLLLKELKRTGLASERLVIDPQAVVISEEDRASEIGLRNAIASTASGTGAAVVKRLGRTGSDYFCKDCRELRQFVRPTLPLLRRTLDQGRRVVIEGTQGYGLSVLHSRDYPFVTSRDTTAAGFLSEVGLSPLDVDDVVLVIRSYPIRVGGPSGPLPRETTWDCVSESAQALAPIREFTSVTHTLRRVAQFDPKVVLSAIAANQPTRIVLNHLDYIDTRSASQGRMSDVMKDFVESVENGIRKKIDYVGVDPATVLRQSLDDSEVADVTDEKYDGSAAREHVDRGRFQSDKYPWCRPGFVPLKIDDPMAQPVLWTYADVRRSLDSAFSDDLQWCLRCAGFPVPVPFPEEGEARRRIMDVVLAAGALVECFERLTCPICLSVAGNRHPATCPFGHLMSLIGGVGPTS